jgi:hypothetical protein
MPRKSRCAPARSRRLQAASPLGECSRPIAKKTRRLVRNLRFMKISPLLLIVALFCSADAVAQSACQQLGMDACAPAHVDQRPPCDAACVQDRRDTNRRREEAQDAEWEAGRKDREAAAFQERMNKEHAEEAREREKLQAKANKLAEKGYEYETKKHDNTKALEYYLKAAQVMKPWDLLHKAMARVLTELARYDEAYAEWEAVINDKATPDDQIASLRNLQWSLMYYEGYECPPVPRFNGKVGCYRRADQQTLHTIYVPLPFIEGRSWTPQAERSNGPFTVTTVDGHVWHSEDNNLKLCNMLNARIQTPAHVAVTMLLPDDTIFTLGPNSDITLDSFVYDPNTSHVSATMSVVKGIFRIVAGQFSHKDPMNREIKFVIPPPKGSTEVPAVDAVGIRGSDVEIDFAGPDDPIHSGMKWINVYSGDVTYTDYEGATQPIPVGKYLVMLHGPYMQPHIYDIDKTDNGGKPGLSVTDAWDLSVPPVGRQ